MPPLPQQEDPGDVPAGCPADLRGPRTILWRGLLGGAGAGGLLGALLVLPDSIQAQLAPEPGVAYAVTWSALLVAVPIGALVGLMPALLAVTVWQWQIPRGARRARVAGSAAAALTVAATAAVYLLLTAAPGGGSWTLRGAVVAALALVGFAIAYVSVPAITTCCRRRP